MDLAALRHILLCSIIVFTSSCKQQQNDQQTLLTDKKGILIPSVVTAGEPVMVKLDTCPPPVTFPVPAKPITWTVQTSKGPRKFKLTPPETRTVKYFQDVQNFNTGEGLALSVVACALTDSRGNLWFGTSGGGVSRYDGNSFITLTTSQGLPNNDVHCIAEDKKGNLWFGTTREGAGYFDGISFTSLKTSGQIPDNSIFSILEDRTGNIWFGHSKGRISRYDGKVITVFNSPDEHSNVDIICIVEDHDGFLWFGTRGNGIRRFDGSSFKNFTTGNGLSGNTIIAGIKDRTGRLWFVTNGGIDLYENNRFTKLKAFEEMGTHTISSLMEDRNGDLWFGTTTGDVYRYDGNSVMLYNAKQGLAGFAISSFIEDEKGNFWYGTLGAGVWRFNKNSVTSFTTPEGLSFNIIFSIIQDKNGELWFGTAGGEICHLDKKAFINLRLHQLFGENQLRCMVRDSLGNIWIGTYGGGITYFSGDHYTNYTTLQGLPSNEISSVIFDKRGKLWIGTLGGGVIRFNGKTFDIYSTTQGLADNSIFDILLDRSGNLWFSTGKGVDRFDGKTFTNFSVLQGLASNHATSIFEDHSGNLWFGTEDGGVSVLRKEMAGKLEVVNGKIPEQDIAGTLFENFSTKNGLADNFVYDLLEDSAGNFIIGTNLGFTVLRGGIGEQGKPFPWERIEYYNEKTGYPVKDININSMLLDNSGVIWAGTGEKLVRFNYKALQKDTVPPKVFIQSIRINNERIYWNDLLMDTTGMNRYSKPPNIFEEVCILCKEMPETDRRLFYNKYSEIRFDSISPFYPIPQNLILPHQYNNITFDFGAHETGRPQLVRYQYILEGYDNDWNPVTDLTTASFGNIFEGTYTFKLRAQSPDGVWSDPVSYTFRVMAPWYRTGWMYALYLFSTVFVIIFIFRWRTKALRRKNIILENKIDVRTQQLRKEKDRADDLLLNILPVETAEELKKTGSSKAIYFKKVTVLFTDFKDFTQRSEQFDAQELVNQINFYYCAFDNIISKYNIEKIKTIGDSYMCAGGLPIENKTNPEDLVRAALEIRDFMNHDIEKRRREGKPYFEIRIGLNTGPVVAGIVGSKKFAYDIWGDTVNVASRMESSGEAGKVNISGTTYQEVKDKFTCIHRGKIRAKNKGDIDMYFVDY